MSSRGYWRHAFRLFGMPILAGIAASMAVVLLADLRLGDDSPGIVTLWQRGMASYFIVLFAVAIGLPIVFNLWVLARLVKRARGCGLSWHEYLDRKADEKESRSLSDR